MHARPHTGFSKGAGTPVSSKFSAPRRARGTPGSSGTHGPWRLAVPGQSGNKTASPPQPSASRARCLSGLLRMIPGGRPVRLPFAGNRHRLTRARNAWRPVTAVRHCNRGLFRDAQPARQDPAAWAAAKGVRPCTPLAATASSPASVTCATPLQVGRDGIRSARSLWPKYDFIPRLLTPQIRAESQRTACFCCACRPIVNAR